jgi:geranylgeranyl diphosphate synthase, type II
MVNIETELSKSLARHLSGPDGTTPPHLAESIRYTLLAAGKRIRPRLTLATAAMVELPVKAAVSAAAALEMVHCFTLIHDDLPCMDNDDFRRGRPSNHKIFGEATALLAGDALVTLAIDTLMDAQPHVQPKYLLAALRRLSWAMGARGVIGGQAAENSVIKKPSLEALTQMHTQKTGALFSASLLLPKDLAGLQSKSAKNQSIDRFAMELGLAFQTAEDLEDKKEADSPTNILYYFSKSEAASRASQRLKKAQHELTSAWGSSAEGLTQIGDEVMLKIGSASQAT